MIYVIMTIIITSKGRFLNSIFSVQRTASNPHAYLSKVQGMSDSHAVCQFGLEVQGLAELASFFIFSLFVG